MPPPPYPRSLLSLPGLSLPPSRTDTISRLPWHLFPPHTRRPSLWPICTVSSVDVSVLPARPWVRWGPGLCLIYLGISTNTIPDMGQVQSKWPLDDPIWGRDVPCLPFLLHPEIHHQLPVEVPPPPLVAGFMQEHFAALNISTEQCLWAKGGVTDRRQWGEAAQSAFLWRYTMCHYKLDLHANTW